MRVLLLVLVLLLGAAPPAHAHAGGLTPQDHLSTVTGVEPPLPGVTARMVNHGAQLEIRNDGPVPLEVAGRTVRPGEVWRFRDDRTTAPEWEVPLGPAVVRGRVDVTPGPNPLWWLAATLGIAVAAFQLKRAKGLLAAGVLVVTAGNVAHAAGSTLAVTGEPFVPLLAGASGVGLVCWPLAVVAVVAAARGKPAAAFVAAVVGAMLVVAGIPDFDSFRFSQLPFAGPADLDRWLVALTLGGGLGLAAGGFSFMRKEIAR
ncbi:hypothetical protein [Saccharothrix obliqua]|uniref:hypothetical protein n=1 Tax=Saccharothrix obliqua TaxID=2861747 RepID=UPI001C5F9F73|nr:hypothetical protein [Saccharothrix obliqua]MBW4717063.1 hypothetical protein [Saccharothrix obliqua]